MTWAYYNENSKFPADWLEVLIENKLIAPGHVDRRSITEVRADDLVEFTQCHFFAGLGGWSYALRLAGVPDGFPVWTGSCPCQSFSTAGARKGFADSRHLWPTWRGLINECRPAVVFGEQVASATDWLALVRSDLEAMEYAVGCMPIEAASAGARQLRDRFWVGAIANGHSQHVLSKYAEVAPASAAWPDLDCARWTVDQGVDAEAAPECWQAAVVGNCGTGGCGHWWHEPDVGRLVHGLSGRVGLVHALGNAIVPQVAAEFIKAILHDHA